MRILHLSTTDLIGGAGKAAFALHQAELSAGIDSIMHVQRKISDDCRCYCAPTFQKWISYLHFLPDLFLPRIYFKREQIKFSTGLSGINLQRIIREHRPDIVHLHWIASGFISNFSLKYIKIPIIWTMHDMLPFTGGCHHSLGCVKYRFECSQCEVLKSKNTHCLSAKILAQKKKCWHNLNIYPVAVSNWLADCAKQSALFRDRPLNVIGNPHNLQVWQSTDKDKARKRLGLDPNKKVILFTATASTDYIKGTDLLVKSAEFLSNKSSLLFICVGNGSRFKSLGGVAIHNLGYLMTQNEMAQAYSVADLVVVPSYYESFGMVASEAMACSKPVVAFDMGGIKDIVDHKVNGYLAEAFNPSEFARGINFILSLPQETYNEFSFKARSKIERNFSDEIVTAKYFQLYRHALANSVFN